MPPGIADDADGRNHEESGDEKPDDDVGPGLTRQGHARAGQEDTRVAGDVVERARPCRAHVDVVGAAGPEEARQTTLAAKAMVPMAPIVSATGTTPPMNFMITSQRTPAPNAAMMLPLRSAPRACQAGPRATT